MFGEMFIYAPFCPVLEIDPNHRAVTNAWSSLSGARTEYVLSAVGHHSAIVALSNRTIACLANPFQGGGLSHSEIELARNGRTVGQAIYII